MHRAYDVYTNLATSFKTNIRCLCSALQCGAPVLRYAKYRDEIVHCTAKHRV